MTPEQFKDIKTKYEKAKERATRAEGGQAALLEQIKSEFDVSSIPELEKKEKAMLEEIDELNEEIAGLEKGLMSVTDWSAL